MKEQNEHTPAVLFESEGKADNGQPYLTVKQARNYYNYSERAGVDSIFFILYDESSDKPFGLINESKPPLDERLNTHAMLTTAFGGSIDMDGTPASITRVEALEEAGYDVPEESILFVGSTLVSSQMSQIAHGFLVNVTGIAKSQATESEGPEASDEFSRNSTIWMDEAELIANSDWKSIFVYCKLGA